MTVHAFFAAMNAQDADAVTALARPDITIAFGPNEVSGHEGLRELALQTDDQLPSEWVPVRVTQEDGGRVNVDARRVQRWRETGDVASEDEMQVHFVLDDAG